MRELVRNPVEQLRPELDYLRTVCAGLSLPDPVAVHLEPLVGGWAEMATAAAEWSSTAAVLDSLADDAERADRGPVVEAVARAHRETAAMLRTAADALEHSSADAARLVTDAAELLADVGRTASAVLSLPALGADAARRVVVEADERARVCAESVAELVTALLQQWQAVTADLQDTPLLGQAQAQQVASIPDQPDLVHAGGITVAVSTSGGAHVEVTPLGTPAPAPLPPAEPSSVTVAAAAVTDPASSGGGTGIGGGGGSGSGGYAGGGGAGAGGGSAAPAAAPLTGGSRVAAFEDGPGSRPAAASSAPAAASATPAEGTGRTGSMGGGMMGMGVAGAGGGGQDTERKRSTRYVADPEEVFGTPQKTAPPVIGERSS